MIDKDKLDLNLKAPTPKAKIDINSTIVSNTWLEQTTKVLPIDRSIYDYTEAIKEIEAKGKEAPKIIGVRLNVKEHEVLSAGLKLIHQRSQVVDNKKDDYYTGDAGDVTPDAYGLRRAKLSVSIYDWCKAINEGKKVSTHDIKSVAETINNLCSRPYFMEYAVQTKNRKGEKITQIKVRTSSLLSKSYELNHVTKETMLIIEFDEIFTANVGKDGKYSRLPIDSIQRLKKGWQSERTTPIIHNLQNYLLPIHNGGKKLIHRERWSVLLPKIAGDWRTDENGNFIREDKLKKNVIRALNGIKKDGLIKEWSEELTVKNEEMIKIIFNKEWI